MKKKIVLAAVFFLFLALFCFHGSLAATGYGGEVVDGESFVGALGGADCATYSTADDVVVVTLTSDVQLLDSIQITAGSYKLQGSGTISRAEGYRGTLIRINGGVSLEIGGSVILDGGADWKKDGEDSTPAEGASNQGISNASQLITGGGLTLSENAVLQNNQCYEGAGVDLTGSFVMTGGTIRNMKGTYAVAIHCNANITLSGGTITGNAGSSENIAVVESESGWIHITGGTFSNNSGGRIFGCIRQHMTVTGGEFLNNRGTVLVSWFNMNYLDLSGGTFTGNSRAVWTEDNKPVNLSGSPEFTTDTDSLNGKVVVTGSLTCVHTIPISMDTYSLGAVAVQASSPELLAESLPRFKLCSSDPELLINSRGRVDTNPTSLVTDGESMVSALGGSEFASYTYDENTERYTVTLKKDVVRSRQIFFESGKYKLQGSGTISRAEGYRGTLIRINGGVSLEIGGSVVLDGGAVWKKNGEDSTPADGASNVGIQGSQLITGGGLTLSENAVLQNNQCYEGAGVDLTGSFVMTGGTIRNMKGTYAVAVHCNANITFSGGTITGNAGSSDNIAVIESEYGWIHITGGTFSNNSGGRIIGCTSQHMTVTGGEFLNNRGTVLVSYFNMNYLDLSGGTFTGNSRAVWSDGSKPVNLSGSPEFTTDTDSLNGKIVVTGSLTCVHTIPISMDTYSLGAVAVQASSPELLAENLPRFTLCSSDPALLINSEGRVDTNPTSLVTDGESMVSALGGSDYASYTYDESTELYTVTLKKDVKRAYHIFMKSGKYKLQGSGTISRAEGYTGSLIRINDGVSLEIGGSVVLDGGAVWKKNGEDSTPADGASNAGIQGSQLVTGSSLTLSGNAVLQNNQCYEGAGVDLTGSFVMTGGTIRNMKGTYAVAVHCNANITISGGAITGNAGSSDNIAVIESESGWIHITGGTFSNNSGGRIIGCTSQHMTVTGGEFLNNRGTVLVSYFNMNYLDLSGGTFTGNSRAVWSDGSKPANLYGNPAFTTDTDTVEGKIVVTGPLTGSGLIRIRRDNYVSNDVAVEGTDTHTLTAEEAAMFVPATNAPENVLLIHDASGNRILISRLAPVIITASVPETVVYTGEPVSPDVVEFHAYLYDGDEAGEEITDRYAPAGGSIGVYYQYRPAGSSGAYTDGMPSLPGSYSVSVRTAPDNLNRLAAGSAVFSLTVSNVPIRVEAAAVSTPIVYDGQPVAHGTDFNVHIYLADGSGTEITNRYTVGHGDVAVTYRYRDAESTGDYAIGLPKEAGTYTIAVTVAGDNELLRDGGSASFELTIRPKVVELVLGLLPDVYYSGEAWTPEVSVTGSGLGNLVLGRDYELTYSGNLTPGTCTVTASGLGNYQGCEGSASFTIMTIPVLVEAAAADSPIVYDGQAVEEGIDFTAGVFIWKNRIKGTEITGDYSGELALVYQYRPDGSEEWTEGLPAAVGTYRIQVTAPADGARYRDGGTATFSLEILSDHSITFLPNGGTGSMDPVIVTDGQPCDLPASTFERAGYHFACWKDADGTEYGDQARIEAVTSNMVMTAQWEEDTQYISVDTYDQAGGLNTTGGRIRYTVVPTAGNDLSPWDGETGGATKLCSTGAGEVTLEAFAEEGYVFIGWFAGETKDASAQTLLPTDRLVTLDAGFTAPVEGDRTQYKYCAVFAEIRSLDLPSSLTSIEAETFAGIRASVVNVPASCRSIGDGAFRDSSVSVITLPAGCELGDGVFNGCGKVILISAEESFAHDYCNENHGNCYFRKTE